MSLTSDLRGTQAQRLADAVRSALDALGQRPAALITDIDGTISRIVSRPEDAVVSERAREALRRLAGRLALVAVITAREEATARRLVGLAGIAYVGNYALDGAAQSGLRGPDLAPARKRVETLLSAFPCVTLEEKGVSFALHYRNCENPDEVRRRLLDLVQPLAVAADGRLLEGKRVMEVVPAALPDKGAAIVNLARQRGLKGIVYLGDDVSDVAVFQELRRRREAGLAGLGVAVGDDETDASVSEEADLMLRGVDEVEDFLAGLAQALEQGGAP